MKIRRVRSSRLWALSVIVLLSLAAWSVRQVGWFGKNCAAIVLPPAPLHATFAELPLIFEANAGQTDARVRFLAQGSGYRFFLTGTEAVWMLRSAEPATPPAAERSAPAASRPDTVLRMALLGANPEPQIVGAAPLATRVNYLTGPNPAAWHTGIPTFAQVRCAQVWPGIDLVYYGKQQQLECDFIVAPGVDPAVIRLGFTGAQSLSVDAVRGDLVLETAGGTVRWRPPVLYQEIDGVHQPVAGKYVRTGPTEAGFAVAAYDPGRPLIIDPVFAYATYLGGGSGPQGMGIAVDDAGQAYVAGETSAPDFPTTDGALQSVLRGGSADRYGGNDVYVAKLNAAGTGLVYSTYIGGTGDDWALAIALDSAGCAYVTGQTKSADFPLTPGAFQTVKGGSWDAFILKLNADGSALLYSTYLGGARDDLGFAIAVDTAGQAHVTGWTLSADFPTTPGAFQQTSGGSYEAFVTKLSAAGTPLYSTYLGGSLADKGYSIALDPAGLAYVTGLTNSPNFPSTTGALRLVKTGVVTNTDTFVTKLDPAGFPVYSAIFGGTKDDAGNGIKVDAGGSAYIAGLTASVDFPTTPGAFQLARGKTDGFAAKLNPAGSALLYSTHLGGNGHDTAYGMAIDFTGAAYITGFTYSTNFPVVGAPLQPTYGGAVDAFVIKLNPAGSPLNGGYSTYLGGNAFDQGEAIAVDGAGRAYVAGVTASRNFPTTPGSFQPIFKGTTQDPFVVKVVP